MDGSDLHEHIRQLARDLDVRVWVCENCSPSDYSEGECEPERQVFLVEPPTRPSAYLTALHELGHIAGHPCRMRSLRDAEAMAWIWAINESRIPLRWQDWAMIAWKLGSYRGRGRQPKLYRELLEEARTRALDI